MGKNYMEERIVKAGVRLCKNRIDRKGTLIVADDLLQMKVATMSPSLRSFYIVVGLFFAVFGIWAQNAMEIMIVSFVPVLMGFGNIAFAVYGRPRAVADLGSEIDIMALTSRIVKSFVTEMDGKNSLKGK